MRFGVDYYPEHWVYPYGGTPEEPEARWAQDVELMVEAGVNVVRMGDFAWSVTPLGAVALAYPSRSLLQGRDLSPLGVADPDIINGGV